MQYPTRAGHYHCLATNFLAAPCVRMVRVERLIPQRTPVDARDTPVDDRLIDTGVGAGDLAGMPAAEATTDNDKPSAPPARHRTRSVRSPGRSIRTSLAWPALLIVVVRIGVGLMLERAALGMIGFLNFPPSRVLRPENGSIVYGFIRWDAAIYMRIAQHGYQPNFKDDSAFYPLYPYLTRAVSRVTPLSLPDAALAVSWVSLWLAVWGVIRLTALIFPGSKSWRAGALLAFIPVSVFLLSGYAESLYVALFAWSVVALVERRPWVAAVLIGFVAVTRLEGVLLVLALIGWTVQDELTHRGRSVLRAAARIAGMCAVSLAPLLAYLVFVRQRYGSFLEELTVNKLWHRHLSWPLHPLFASLWWIVADKIHGRTAANAVATYLVDDGLMVAALLGLAALGLIVWRRRELWWLLPPVFLALLIIASDAPFGDSPEAWGRNVMVLVPLYAVASRVKSEVSWSMLLAGSALLAALFQIMFNVGFWLT